MTGLAGGAHLSVCLLDLVDLGDQPFLGHAMIRHQRPIACMTTKGTLHARPGEHLSPWRGRHQVIGLGQPRVSG